MDFIHNNELSAYQWIQVFGHLDMFVTILASELFELLVTRSYCSQLSRFGQ